MKKGLFLGAGLFLITLLLSPSAYAEIKIGDNFSLYGDGRGRFEADTRTRVSGTSYQDQERDRFRYRLRAGFTYIPSEYLEFGGRLSSGDTRDAHSPHVVFGSDNNSDSGVWTGDPNVTTVSGTTVTTANERQYALTRDSVSIDKAYIKGKYMGGFAWIGKNSMPLWKQNEYYWDDDINPEGTALGYTLKGLGPVSITAQGGYFIMGEGGWFTSGKGDPDKILTTYQGVVNGGLPVADFALSYTAITTDDFVYGRAQDPDTQTTSATYTAASLQAKVKAIPDIPITIGYDLLGSDDNRTLSGKKADGSAVSGSGNKAQAGSVISLGGSFKDFSTLLMLVDIEKYAVTVYAQDDWANYYSDMSGYELRVGYKFAKNINLDIRRFDASRKTDSKVDEQRTQINLNVSF